MSSLSAQLARARQAVGVKSPVVRRGKPSLLFSPQEAAELDAHAIYQLGLRGFQELCGKDSRFEPYAATLFGQAAAELDRDAKSPESNRKLDASVAAFLALLAEYFLLPAAMQALEFLVRRLSVHEHNQEALMGAALVYHETHQFVRLVQIMPLERSTWAFLVPMQRSGAPLPRATLVQRCLNDQAVLRFVAENARRAAASGAGAQLQVAFFAVLTAEVLQATPKRLDEGTAALLLPHVRAGLAKGGGVDLRAAAHIILAQLAASATLSDELLSELLEDIVKNAQPAEMQEVLLLVAQLFASQPQLTSFPDKPLKHLVKVLHLAAELAAMGELHAVTEPLLSALLPTLAGAHPAVSVHAPLGTHEELVVALVKGVPLSAAVAEAAAAALLRAALDEEDSESPRSISLGRMLRALYKKHAAATEAAVNGVLADSTADTGSGRRQRLLPLLRAGLAGGAGAPLPNNSMTMRLAVDAVSAATRITALRALDRAAQEDGASLTSEQREFLVQALLRRLADDSADVVAVALGLSDSLRLVPPAALFDGLSALLRRAMTGMKGLSAGDRKAVRGNARKAVKVLAGEFLGQHPGYSERAGSLLLGLLMPIGVPFGKLPAAALRALKTINHPLFAGLKSVKSAEVRAAADDEQQANIGAEITTALGERLAEDAAARKTLGPLLEHAPPVARMLLLVAARHACSAESAAQVAPAVLAALLAAAAATDAAAPAGGPDAADMPAALAGVQREALLAAVQALPAYQPDKLQDAYRAIHILAALQPAGDYDELLGALLAKAASAQPPPQFLATIFGSGLPLAPALQERSLLLLQQHLAAATDQPADAAAALAPVLPHLLVALSSPHAAVRSAALAAAQAAADAWGASPEKAEDDGDSDAEAGAAMSAQHLGALLAAIAAARDAVMADPDSAVQLVADTLAAAPEVTTVAAVGSYSGSGQLAKTPARRGRPRKAAPAAAAAEQTNVGPLALPAAAAAAAGSALAQRLGGLTEPADAAAGRATLRALAAWRTAAERLRAALPLLRALSPAARRRAAADATAAALAALTVGGGVAVAKSHPATAEADERSALFAEALALYRPEAVSALLPEDPEVLQPLAAAGWGLREALRAGPGERAAARRASTRELHDVLPPDAQRQMFLGLLWGSHAETDGAYRAAAREALQRLPLRLEHVQPMLESLAGTAEAAPPTTARKRARGRKVAAEHAAPALPCVDAVDAAVVVLELLGWADADGGNAPLVPLLCGCLRALAAAAAAPAPAVPAASADAAADGSGAHGGSEDDDEGGNIAAKPGLAGYAMQLALAALQRIAEPQAPAGGDEPMADAEAAAPAAAEAGDWDVGAVAAAARAAPDGAARNQALALLAALARSQPQAALQHAMDVVAVAGGAAAAHEDVHSTAVATEALLAVLPAWLAAGRPPADAATAVIDAALGLPPHRRLPLVAALRAALPEEQALPLVLLELLRRAAADQHAAAEHAAQLAAAAASKGAAADAGAGHPLALAASLCSQASELHRARGYLAVLQAASQPADGGAPPQLQLATLFVASRLHADAGSSGQSDGVTAGADSTENGGSQLQDAYASLLLQGLLQQQGLGAEGAPGGKKAAAAASEALLSSLQAAMAPGAHAAALVALATDSQTDGVSAAPGRADSVVPERVRRRALRLLAAAAEGLGARLATADADEQPALAAAADAALAFCPLLSVFFVAGSEGGEAAAAPTTRQAALVTFGALAQHLGRARPAPLTDAAPAVLGAVDDPNRAVRSSALAATAALVAGLGAAAVPLLPRLAPRALRAAGAALSAVRDEEDKPADAEEAEPLSPGSPAKGGKRSKKVQIGRAEAAALEAAAALAVAASLVRTLPKFLSPYLPAMLEHTLNPLVWGQACTAAGAANTAATIRLLLPTSVPPRLLLPALVAHLPTAQAAGAQPVVELLAMAAALLGAHGHASVATHAETTFRFLLPALDMRQTHLATFGPEGVAAVERQAVAALEALTVKLSERTFKPLFLRFVEWARASLPAGPGGQPPPAGGRPAVLFAAAAALTARLRSIFVPYFRYLLDPALAALEAGGESDAKKPAKKKRRKSAEAEASAAPAAPEDAAAQEASWRLRTQVLLALGECFAHDSVGFLDEGRFQRLLPPLAEQLHGAPPPGAAPALAALLPPELAAPPADSAAAAAAVPDAAADPYGAAAVAALTRLAAAAGSDVMYRPLNRAVLMATRGGDARARRRALAVAAGLVASLREEYGLLLPEALPFLAELLEDEDAGVAAAAAGLVSRLEELTGEGAGSFDQYLKA